MFANVIDIALLCEKIKMPEKATSQVLTILSQLNLKPYSDSINKLSYKETAKEGYEQLGALLESNPDKGYFWLAIYLVTAAFTKERYDEKAIDSVIFYDTISALSRCVKEHFESFGSYGYDRCFWNYRQLNMSLFRIGVLEYEMTTFDNDDAVLNGETLIKKGDNIISIHIPSDAALSPQNCKTSFKAAKDFFAKFYPDYIYSVFYCGSWIVSPNLKLVLPETSNIVSFINNFEIYKVNHDGDGYKTWVFRNKDLSPDQFPQDTSLQRNITAHIKQGGKIGEGYGIIRTANI